MPAKRILIKKYENRRMYDTVNSRYVNLEDLARMVGEGTEIQVIDAVSGDDVTRGVLTQIVVEHAKAPDSGFSLELLHQMVMASGNAGKEGLLNYMRSMADLYKNTYRALTPGLSPFDFFAARPEQPGPPRAADETGASPPGDRPSVEDLHRRIEELERLVAGDIRRKRRAPKVKRPPAAPRRPSR